MTQSADLVEGATKDVAAAVRSEIERYYNGEQVTSKWIKFRAFDEAMSSFEYFHNVPTIFLVLRTNSKWSVVWNNSFLCDGYAALCYNLTRRYGMTTIHWSAHDELTTFQAGATFVHESKKADEIRTRSVYCAQEDKRWHFYESGAPLAEEDVPGYLKRRKRGRLNEARLMALLGALGAQPWSLNFYDFNGGESNVLYRGSLPEAVRKSKREPNDVIKPPCRHRQT